MADTMWYSVIGIIFAAIAGFWLYMESKYKLRVTIKEVVRGRTLLKVHRARQFIDSDKSSWWKISKETDKAKKLLPIPPEDAIEIDSKGKKHASCYRLESGEIIWIKDDWTVKEIPKFDVLPDDIADKIAKTDDNMAKKEIADTWRKQQVSEWIKVNKVITPLKPITTNQRMSYFNNIKKAESRHKNDWKQQLIPIASIGGLVIVVLALIVLYGEIAQPVLQADQITANQHKMQLEIVEILKDIKTGQQTIGTAQPSGSGD